MRTLAVITLGAILVRSCAPSQGGGPPAATSSPIAGSPTAAPKPTTTPVAAATSAPSPAAAKPAFLLARLTDVRTGEGFTLGQFEGKVVIVQGMAVW